MRKMLNNIIILSLCFVAIHAAGEFSILSSPKSISFKGNDVLPSRHVGQVLSASMGYEVTEDVEWPCLLINDPFKLPKSAIAVFVDGTNHIGLNSDVKTYELIGESVENSLNSINTELESKNVPTCDIDFNNFDQAVDTYKKCFGDVALSALKETKNLNPSLNAADKHFLQSVAYVNAAAKDLNKMKKASSYVVFRLSVDSIAKTHGSKSEATTEANKLITSAIKNLKIAADKSSNGESLFVVIASKSTGQRMKRATADEPTNLAEYYSEDYPVIFNIILWFMVVFGLSLLAICYAIAAMDPGRDSIIYRMTSTRIKKDN